MVTIKSYKIWTESVKLCVCPSIQSVTEWMNRRTLVFLCPIQRIWYTPLQIELSTIYLINASFHNKPSFGLNIIKLSRSSVFKFIRFSASVTASSTTDLLYELFMPVVDCCFMFTFFLPFFLLLVSAFIFWRKNIQIDLALVPQKSDNIHNFHCNYSRGLRIL